jgi:LysR family transcriptional regulator, benzoate and cis,cis-muconate-responsive activator of ben and cat genes
VYLVSGRGAERLGAAADYHAHGGLRRLVIGAPTVTLTDVVSPFVATLEDSDPSIDIAASDGAGVAEMFDRGVDVVISTEVLPYPYKAYPLAALPVWAYVHHTHRWADRSHIQVTDLVDEDLLVLPDFTTARQALERAFADEAVAPLRATEAANGTIAQALAAAGRGVAVVTDDPRFDLRRMVLRRGTSMLSIKLTASWDARHPGDEALKRVAVRLGRFVRARYQV